MLKENQGNIYLENVELGTSRTGLQHTRELCNKYENKFKTDPISVESMVYGEKLQQVSATPAQTDECKPLNHWT